MTDKRGRDRRTIIPPGMDKPDSYDYEGLKRLAYKFNRPLGTLYALSPQNDPFHVGPTGQVEAKWFAALWKKFIGNRTGIHLRRLHYVMISQPHGSIKMPNGDPYENTENCWHKLIITGKDARYLHHVPIEAFIDRRNPKAIIHKHDTGLPSVDIEVGVLTMPKKMPEPPKLMLDMTRDPPQRFQVELWAEKSTMNDILLPLASRHAINVVTGAGELSITACHLFVERVKADGRPVRILYISDFDPSGQSMPVAVARKIEFMVRDQGLDELDIQVRPVVLTKAQCEEYQLPRTPIKSTDHRKDSFEQRHGEGATELDALEALHPGELAAILEREIARYWDDDLKQEVEDAAKPTQAALKRINAKVRKKQAKKMLALKKEYAKLVAAHGRWAKKAKPFWHAIKKTLNTETPDMDDVEWPEPKEGDEDLDPLYDSNRGYVEQIDRYKRFQIKPTQRKPSTITSHPKWARVPRTDGGGGKTVKGVTKHPKVVRADRRGRYTPRKAKKPVTRVVEKKI